MSPVESILKHERRMVVSALLLVGFMAWVYTLSGAGMGMSVFEMTRQGQESMSMDGSPMPMPITVWTLAYAVLMLAMWWVMMIAMMLPSAAPTILLAAALNSRSRANQPPYGGAGFFTLGYLLAWLFFSAVAVAVQWYLQNTGQLSAMVQSQNQFITGGLLVAAGGWQFSPIKQACLRHCRSPVEFLTRRRRAGNRGALLMGIEHGSYCLGCCWFLMALLFVGGVMNIYWIAGLALYVLVEKLLRYGERIGTAVGMFLVGWGIVVLVF